MNGSLAESLVLVFEWFSKDVHSALREPLGSAGRWILMFAGVSCSHIKQNQQDDGRFDTKAAIFGSMRAQTTGVE